MPSTDIQLELRRWFNGTGLPLEISVARSLFQAGFGTLHSAVYLDPEVEKGREIDVLAYKTDPSGCFSAFIVVECKASDKPWIVLTNRHQYGEYTALSLSLMSQRARHSRGEEIFESLDAFNSIFGKSNGGYALKQAFSGQNDQAYVACMSALKASVALVSRKNDDLSFAFPVIVVDSPIYEYSESEAGEQFFKEVTSSFFEFSAYLDTYVRTLIRVVSKGAIEKHALQVRAIAERYEAIYSGEICRILDASGIKR